MAARKKGARKRAKKPATRGRKKTRSKKKSARRAGAAKARSKKAGRKAGARKAARKTSARRPARKKTAPKASARRAGGGRKTVSRPAAKRAGVVAQAPARTPLHAVRAAVARPAEETRPFRPSVRPSLPIRRLRVGRVRPQPNPRVAPGLARLPRRLPRHR